MKRRDLLKFLAVAPVASLVKSDNKTVIEKPIEVPKESKFEIIKFTIAGTSLVGVLPSKNKP
jgi:translation initiation factor 6 (eIF-6)